MTTPTNDGGPAFPMDDHKQTTGMSLRDYFAAQALQGMLCHGFIPNFIQMPVGNTHDFNYAMAAYRVADAMLMERAK